MPVYSVSRPWPRRGVTLVELLLAMVVFLAFFLLYLDTWPVSAQALEKSKHRCSASALAEQQMERALALGYSGVAPIAATSTSVASIVNGAPEACTFTWSVAVSDVNPSTRQVTVTVTWREGGVNQNATLASLISNV